VTPIHLRWLHASGLGLELASVEGQWDSEQLEGSTGEVDFAIRSGTSKRKIGDAAAWVLDRVSVLALG